MFSNVKFVVILVTALSQFSSLSAALSRASYGEPCSKEIRCDSRNFLTCSSSNVCDCLMGDSMTYDESLGKCVTLAGERCLFTTVDGERSWSDELPCISGANCTAGVCNCISTHFEVSNGTCSKKKGYGEECSTDQMCDLSNHLTCGADKKCSCDIATGLIWEVNACKLLAGKSCSNGGGAECTSGAICESSLCNCSSKHFQAQNGTCLLKGGHGDSCASDKECLETWQNKPTFLQCHQGTCECDSASTAEEYQNGRSICKRQLGHLCSENDCIHGAECINGNCQCVRATHIQAENQTCQERATHGGGCRRNEECIDSLECGTNKKCKCAYRTSFSVPSQKCVVSAGFPCRHNRHSDLDECVPNAVCKQVERGYRDYEWLCKCNDYGLVASPTGDGLCYATYRSSCDGDSFGPLTSRQCLPNLVCHEESCKCRYYDNQIYKQGKCLSFVRGPCNETSDCSSGAAECSLQDGVKKCLCKQGYNEVGRECRVGHGGKCKPSGPAEHERCDTVAGLTCTSAGVCECPEFRKYNPSEMVCQGLVDAKCENGGSYRFCVDGAFCKPLRGVTDFGECACSPGYVSGAERLCTRDSNETSTRQGMAAEDAFYQSDG